VKLYHSTTRVAADAILALGFRDATRSYLTDREWTGVWLSDRPFDETQGARSEALLEVQAPDDAELTPFEWVEEGKGYREFLMPASMVNAWPVQMVDRGGTDAMRTPVRWYAQWTANGLLCPQGHVIENVGPARARAHCPACGRDFEILDDAHPDVAKP